MSRAQGRGRRGRGTARARGTIAFAALLVAGLPARAQEPPEPDPVVYKLEGGDQDRIGKSVAVLADFDGDGIRDFATNWSFLGNNDFSGQVILHSGKDGKTIRTWNGNPAGVDHLGEEGLYAMPDLDGDGRPELGAHGLYTGLHVYSPVTGDEWYSLDHFRDGRYHTGPSIVVMPDVDGDGIGEFVGGFRDASLGEGMSKCGQMALFSGRDARLIWRAWGTSSDAFFGFQMALSGDHDGDGVPDILSTEYLPRDEGRFHLENDSVIHVISGRTGNVIRTHGAPTPRHFAFGHRIVSLGDRDGDGFPEVAVSAPYYRRAGLRGIDEGIPDNGIKEGRYRGWIGVFRLPGFQPLFEMDGRDAAFYFFAGDWLGTELASAGDADGDRIPDLLAGTYRRDGNLLVQYGRMYLVSGKDGKAICTYEGFQEFSPFFEGMHPLDDLDKDGSDEFLVTHSLINLSQAQTYAGTLHVLRSYAGLPRFMRGDANGDGQVNITDVFLIARTGIDEVCGSSAPIREPVGCRAAYDVDVDGCISIWDARWLVFYLFGYLEQSPGPPFPECGRFVRIEPFRSFRHLSCDDPGSCSDG